VEVFEGIHVVFDDAVLVLAALCDVTQIESNLSVSHSPSKLSQLLTLL
jgi:hypothetical protein